jgi:hypothetical protein
MKRKRLGEVLRERGHVSAVDLDKALQEQKEQAKLVHLGELMLKRGVVAKADLISALTEVSSVPYFDCTEVQPKPEILQLIPADMARRCLALPVDTQHASVLVAMAEPQNLQAIDELRFKTGKKIVPRLAFHGELIRAIDKHYGLPEPPTKDTGAADQKEEEKRAAFEHVVQRVFMHQTHAISAGNGAHAVICAAFTHQAADGIIEDEQFVDSDAAFVAGHVAFRAAHGQFLDGGRCGEAGLQQLASELWSCSQRFVAHAKFRIKRCARMPVTEVAI